MAKISIKNLLNPMKVTKISSLISTNNKQNLTLNISEFDSQL